MARTPGVLSALVSFATERATMQPRPRPTSAWRFNACCRPSKPLHWNCCPNSRSASISPAAWLHLRRQLRCQPNRLPRLPRRAGHRAARVHAPAPSDHDARANRSAAAFTLALPGTAPRPKPAGSTSASAARSTPNNTDNAALLAVYDKNRFSFEVYLRFIAPRMSVHMGTAAGSAEEYRA